MARSLITPSRPLLSGTQITVLILDVCILPPVEGPKAHGVHVTTITISGFKLTFENQQRLQTLLPKEDRMQISRWRSTDLLTARTGWHGLFTNWETESRYGESLQLSFMPMLGWWRRMTQPLSHIISSPRLNSRARDKAPRSLSCGCVIFVKLRKVIFGKYLVNINSCSVF